MSSATAVTAYKAEPASQGALALDTSVVATSYTHATAKTDTLTLDVTSSRRAEARMKGYEGESCSECGNFTMVRNGTCLKCDTCGSTSGCS